MAVTSHEREAIRKQLLSKFEALVDGVIASRASSESCRDVEESIVALGNELTASAIGQWLEGFDTNAPRVVFDGREFYRLDSIEKTYATSRGDVRVERGVYRERGVHNGPTMVPLELRAGMVEGVWTPACAERMAFLAQKEPERQAAQTGAKIGGMAYSSSSFQRVRKVLGERWELERDVFETEVVERSTIPAHTASASVAIDRVSLLMREGDVLAQRMAYLGAITMYDADGEPLKTWRYGRMPGEGSHIVREQMQWDVLDIQKRRPDLRWMALSDGSHELCDLLDEDYPDMPRLVDFWHVTEKLGEALRACCSKDVTERTLRKWALSLLSDDDAIELIEKTIKRWNRGSRQAVHDALTYIENHREQMRYATLRATNLPIGSGHVESTCKQLVALRMKRNGQRWGFQGGQAVMTLRAAGLSDRWDATMDVLLESCTLRGRGPSCRLINTRLTPASTSSPDPRSQIAKSTACDYWRRPCSGSSFRTVVRPNVRPDLTKATRAASTFRNRSPECGGSVPRVLLLRPASERVA